MAKRKNLVGQRFERLVVVKEVGRSGYSTIWECVCDCGNVINSKTPYLLSGDTKSCGCLKKEKCGHDKKRHGFTTLVGGRQEVKGEYHSWAGMIQRCNNPNHTYYKNYGAKGTKVCEPWLKFDNFIADMGLRPKGTTLDRIDPFGNYEPGNCRWADKMTQRHNRRQNIKPSPTGAING